MGSKNPHVGPSKTPKRAQKGPKRAQKPQKSPKRGSKNPKMTPQNDPPLKDPPLKRTLKWPQKTSNHGFYGHLVGQPNQVAIKSMIWGIPHRTQKWKKVEICWKSKINDPRNDPPDTPFWVDNARAHMGKSAISYQYRYYLMRFFGFSNAQFPTNLPYGGSADTHS